MNQRLDLNQPIESLLPRRRPSRNESAGKPAGGATLPDRLRAALQSARHDAGGKTSAAATALATVAEVIDADAIALLVDVNGALSVRDLTLDASHRDIRSNLTAELRLAASEALRGAGRYHDKSTALPGATVIASAFPDRKGVVAAHVRGSGDSARVSATLELVACAFTSESPSLSDSFRDALSRVCTALEDQAATDPAELAEPLRKALGARQIIIAAADGSLLTMAPATPLRPDSPGQVALRELVGRSVGAARPVVDRPDGGPQNLSALLGAELIVALRITTNRRGAEWVALAVDPQPGFPRADAQSWAVVEVMLEGILQQPGKRVRKRRARPQWSAALGAAALAVAVMFIPVGDRIRAEAELEPEGRRVVTATFNAVLRHADVKPGDRVGVGTLIAELEGEEIVLARAAAAARANEAFRRSDAAIDTKNITDAELARLEGVAASAERDVLDWQLGQLQLKSPVDGLVIASPFEHSGGAPVREGDVIAEVAPIDRLRVRVDVPVDDLERLADVQGGELHLDGISGKPALLTGLSPAVRAETRDGQTVIALRTTIDNPGRALRPGQRGVALLPTGSAMLGEILFRKAWGELRRWTL